MRGIVRRSLYLLVIAVARDSFGADMQAISLERAEQLMRANTPALRIARYSYDASGAETLIADEAPNPQLSLNSSSINYANGIGSGAPWDKQVDSILRIDQQFERGGKRALRHRAALAGERVAAADWADTLRTSKLNLAQAYFDLKFTQEAEQIASRLVELQAQSLSAARIRLRTGDVASVDVARLEIEVARASAELSAARTARRGAVLSLAQIIGSDERSSDLEASDEWPTPINISAGASTDAPAGTGVNDRPDVRAAQARREQAEANVSLANAQRTRDVTVGLQFERFPQGASAGMASPNSVGFGFSLPLFLRHRYQGEIQRASADRRVAEETLRSAQIAAATDQSRAAAEIEGARDRLQQFRDAIVEKAKSTAEAAEYAYSRGALDLTDLLDARRAMQAVSLDALSAQAAYAKALAAWRAATDTSAVVETR